MINEGLAWPIIVDGASRAAHTFSPSSRIAVRGYFPIGLPKKFLEPKSAPVSRSGNSRLTQSFSCRNTFTQFGRYPRRMTSTRCDGDGSKRNLQKTGWPAEELNNKSARRDKRVGTTA